MACQVLYQKQQTKFNFEAVIKIGLPFPVHNQIIFGRELMCLVC